MDDGDRQILLCNAYITSTHRMAISEALGKRYFTFDFGQGNINSGSIGHWDYRNVDLSRPSGI